MKTIEIRCPICNKWIAEKTETSNAEGIYFWCIRCKKKIIIKDNSALVANELGNYFVGYFFSEGVIL